MLVPRSRSQVISPGQAWALMRVLAPPVAKTASCARIASIALCRLVSAAVRSDEVAKGPADCRAKISASCPSSLVSLRASAASIPVCCT